MSISTIRESELNSYSMIVKLKDEQEREEVFQYASGCLKSFTMSGLGNALHSLTMFPIMGITSMVAEINEEGQKIYRSKERIRLIELPDNMLEIKCEEHNIFVSLCSYLNRWKVEYTLDKKETVAFECTFNDYSLAEIVNISTSKSIPVIKDATGLRIIFAFDKECIKNGAVASDKIVKYIKSIEAVHYTDDEIESTTTLHKQDIQKIDFTPIVLEHVQDTLQEIKNSYKVINESNIESYLDDYNF